MFFSCRLVVIDVGIFFPSILACGAFKKAFLNITTHPLKRFSALECRTLDAGIGGRRGIHVMAFGLSIRF